MAEFEAPADDVLQLKLTSVEYRPLISIIMPVFDTKPAELSAAITSVIAQSYPYWELCIADDGSKSRRSGTFFRTLNRATENLRFIFLREQGGYRAALNAAFRVASGSMSRCLTMTIRFHLML